MPCCCHGDKGAHFPSLTERPSTSLVIPACHWIAHCHCCPSAPNDTHPLVQQEQPVDPHHVKPVDVLGGTAGGKSLLQRLCLLGVTIGVSWSFNGSDNSSSMAVTSVWMSNKSAMDLTESIGGPGGLSRLTNSIGAIGLDAATVVISSGILWYGLATAEVFYMAAPLWVRWLSRLV